MQEDQIEDQITPRTWAIGDRAFWNHPNDEFSEVFVDGTPQGELIHVEKDNRRYIAKMNELFPPSEVELDAARGYWRRKEARLAENVERATPPADAEPAWVVGQMGFWRYDDQTWEPVEVISVPDCHGTKPWARITIRRNGPHQGEWLVPAEKVRRTSDLRLDTSGVWRLIFEIDAEARRLEAERSEAERELCRRWLQNRDCVELGIRPVHDLSLPQIADARQTYQCVESQIWRDGLRARVRASAERDRLRVRVDRQIEDWE